MKTTFLGGAGTVTGSKTLVDVDGKLFLVDCGMFQGFKHLRLKNREPFDIDPARVSAVALTHAHLDHTGYLPVLARNGFRGKIYCTEATRGLVEILLLDAARIEEEQALWLKAKKKSKHEDPQPLFTSDDVQRVLELMTPVAFGARVPVVAGATAAFTAVGHILGAASIHVQSAQGASVVFSGDVGRPNDAMMRPPEVPPRAGVLVLESTYGGRKHREQDVRAALADVITRTVARRGIVMIPAFAVGRAQAVLHLVQELMEAGRIPRVPVFLNSPMAQDVTALVCAHHAEHRLSDAQCRALCELAVPIKTTEQSKELNQRAGPMIVVAGSGMMTGGRIIHHLAAWGGDKKNTLLLVGYQAPGTRGAHLLAGNDTLRLFGDDVPIRAEVEKIDALSGHADADELLAWLRTFPWRPRQVLLNHGEPEQSDALRLRIERELAWPARVVIEHDSFDVDVHGVAGTG